MLSQVNDGRMDEDFLIDEELGLVGRSPAFLAAIEDARIYARTDLPILIVGETGTGKELVARHVHRLSGREGEFVDIDCGAVPDAIADSLLFGHRRGAFTGAHETSPGLLEQADGGTLFLDELTSLSDIAQRKLLRAIECGEVRRVGGYKVSVDLRVVAAVQDDIRDMVGSREFRFDLLERLGGAVVRVPPLSQRLEDVAEIARHYAGESGGVLTADAIGRLVGRKWCGNVRELQWTIKRAIALSEGGRVDVEVLSRALSNGSSALLASDPAEDGSRLRSACAALNGDPDLIADALDISRATLYRRLKDADLRLDEFRGADAP